MDSTRRFSSRVADYVRYRPSYPAAIVTHLRQQDVLTDRSVIADIGSGTGLLTKLFLDNGNRVFGVEPNADMRRAGEQQLADYPLFTSTDGTAEATGLPAGTIDLITAGQAFHWFDRDRARHEFRRILRPPGWVALVWNDRLVDVTPFLRDYERLLQAYATDYAQVDHRHMTDEVISAFFHPHGYRFTTFPNHQAFDLEGLTGRLLSSSYAPEKGHPSHEPMLAELARAFRAHQAGGRVTFAYETKLYVGRLLP